MATAEQFHCGFMMEIGLDGNRWAYVSCEPNVSLVKSEDVNLSKLIVGSNKNIVTNSVFFLSQHTFVKCLSFFSKIHRL